MNAKKFTDDIGILTYPANLFLDNNNVLKYVEGGIAYIFDEKGSFKMGEGNEIIKILEILKK